MVGDFIPLVSSQLLGYLVRHLYVFIGPVPIKNSFKLMIVICISSVQMVNCSVLNEGGAGSGSQGKITIFLVKIADFKEAIPILAKEI